jgi:hypothetical protein
MYFGDVEGTPEIPMIEAETIDDFERLFHEAVDDYLDRRSSVKSKTRWGLIIAVIIIIGLLVAMVLTCPKKEQHVNVLTEKLNYILSDTVDSEDDFKILGAMLGSAIAKQVLNMYLNVDDHVLFSVGRLEYKGENNIMSIGAFGHIFTISNEELKRRVEQNNDSQEFLNRFK